jgi:magnesium chelatase subunit D
MQNPAVGRVLAEGVTSFQPGLLAAAHRGVLYVDEVNLLHEHLVDLLLDAAALGTSYVERDGVSVRHEARFLLVGTMNPEEGELRPQLLDRFGLTVETAAPRDPASRAEEERRRNACDADPSRRRSGGCPRWCSMTRPWN